MTGPIWIDSLHNVSRWTSAGDIELAFYRQVRDVIKIEGSWKEKLGRRAGNHYVSLSAIAADGCTDLLYLDGVQRNILNMFSLVNKTTTDVLGVPCIAAPRGGPGSQGSVKPFISFSSSRQAKNALDFICRTKFMRAYLAIIKIDQHAADSLMDEIPWLNWEISWNDELLAKHFGLTTNEILLIDEIIQKITV
jgi:hypothetical protein